MQMSKTEERMRRRDLRKIFVDPNACGVALPTVGFDSETATRGGFSAQDDTRGFAPPFYLFKQTDKSKFEARMPQETAALRQNGNPLVIIQYAPAAFMLPQARMQKG
jgi:hypothetical protein